MALNLSARVVRREESSTTPKWARLSSSFCGRVCRDIVANMAKLVACLMQGDKVDQSMQHVGRWV